MCYQFLEILIGRIRALQARLQLCNFRASYILFYQSDFFATPHISNAPQWLIAQELATGITIQTSSLRSPFPLLSRDLEPAELAGLSIYDAFSYHCQLVIDSHKVLTRSQNRNPKLIDIDRYLTGL